MSDADIITKKYMSDNERFADAFNYYLFGGRQIIHPESLEEQDTTELVSLIRKDNVYTKGRNRDLKKRWTEKPV